VTNLDVLQALATAREAARAAAHARFALKADLINLDAAAARRPAAAPRLGEAEEGGAARRPAPATSPDKGVSAP